MGKIEYKKIKVEIQNKIANILAFDLENHVCRDVSDSIDLKVWAKVSCKLDVVIFELTSQVLSNI